MAERDVSQILEDLKKTSSGTSTPTTQDEWIAKLRADAGPSESYAPPVSPDLWKPEDLQRMLPEAEYPVPADWKPPAYQYTPSKGSVMDEFARGMESGLRGIASAPNAAIAMAGNLVKQVGATNVGQAVEDFGRTGMDYWKPDPRFNNAPRVTKIEDVQGTKDLVDYLAGAAGQFAPQVGLSVMGGGLGAFGGKALAQRMLPNAFSQFPTAASTAAAGKMINRGIMAGVGATGMAQENEQIASMQLEKNQKLDAFRAIPFAALAGATEIVPVVSLLKRTGMGNQILKRLGVNTLEDAVMRGPGIVPLVKSIVAGGMKMAGIEAGQEGIQTELERAGVEGMSLTDAEARSDVLNSMIQGGFLGLVTGGAGGSVVPVRPNMQRSGQRLSDIFQTGGELVDQQPLSAAGQPLNPSGQANDLPVGTDLANLPDADLTYLGRREHPPVSPLGLPEPSNMLPEPVDSLGNKIPYSGSVPPAPELGPTQRTWFPYGSEGDETAYPTSSAARQVDLTQSPARPPATGTTTPSAPVDLTSPQPQTMVTPAIAKTIDETSRISSMLDETTILDTQVHPTTGDLVVLDPDQSLAGIMQNRGALFNEAYRSWVVPRSKINDLIPELQATAPAPTPHPSSQSLAQTASNAINQQVQFGDQVERSEKKRTPPKTFSELGPLEMAINAAAAAQPEESLSQPGTLDIPEKTALQRDNQDRMNAMLEAAGLGAGRLAAKGQEAVQPEAIAEPRTGITMPDKLPATLETTGQDEGRLAARNKTGPPEGLVNTGIEPPTAIHRSFFNKLRRLMAPGQRDAGGKIIAPNPESRTDIGARMNSGFGMPTAVKGFSASEVEKLSTYTPELRGVVEPEEIIMSNGEAFRHSGRTAYRYNIPNHYNADLDPLGLWKQTAMIHAANSHAHPGVIFSNLVKKHGYSGYVFNFDKEGKERWVATFTPVKIQENLGKMSVKEQSAEPAPDGVRFDGEMMGYRQFTDTQSGRTLLKDPGETMDQFMERLRPAGKLMTAEGQPETVEESAGEQQRVKHSAVKSFVRKLNKSLPPGLRVVAIQSTAELPDAIQSTLLRLDPDSKVFGYMDPDGTCYLVTSSFETIEHIYETLAHELIGHYGLEQMMGEAAFNKMMLSAYDSMMSHSDTKAEMTAIWKLYNTVGQKPNFDLHTQEGKIRLMGEMVAHISETSQNPTWFENIISSVRAFLRQLGFTVEWTNQDIRAMLQQSSDYIFSNPVKSDATTGGLQIKVFHGTGQRFRKFDFNKIGSESGQMAYGWGAYVSDIKGVGMYYAEKAGKTSPSGKGWTGTFIIHKGKDQKDYQFLDWNTPVDPQLLQTIHDDLTPEQQVRFDDTMNEYAKEANGNRGAVVYQAVRDALYGQSKEEAISAGNYYPAKVESARQASLFFVAHGISGMRYPAGKKLGDIHYGTTAGHDYVIYDESAMDVEKFQRTYQRKQGQFLVRQNDQLGVGSVMVQMDTGKLAAAVPPSSVNYLANGKALPLLKDLPDNPDVHKLWTAVSSVMRSLINPQHPYLSLNRSMVEDILGQQPALNGPAKAAWTDLQNFYASVLGTLAEPKRIKITTEITDMPERMARFAVKKGGILQDDEFYKRYLRPYMNQAKREIDMAGEVGIQEFIRKNRPTVNSDSKRAIQGIADLLDEYAKSRPQETGDNQKIVAPEKVANWKQEVEKTREFVKRFKDAVDIYRNVWIQALDQQAGKTESKPAGRQEYLVNGKPMPDFSQSNSQAVQVTMEKIHILLKILSGQSTGKRLYAQLSVQKVLKNVGKGELGSWRPGLSNKTFGDLIELSKWYYDTFGQIDWRNPPDKFKPVDVKMTTPGATSTMRDQGGSFLIRQGKPPSGPVATEYKLLRTLKTRPGEVFSLFIGNKESIPVGEWLTAEPLPTAGFADRPGWHTSKTPSTKHLSEANRVWAEVEVPATTEDRVAGKPPSPNGQYKFPRPAAQGGEWTISGSIKVVKILTPEEVEKTRSGKLSVRLAIDNTKRHTVVRVSDSKVVASFSDQKQAWDFIAAMPKEDRGKHYYERRPTPAAVEANRRMKEGSLAVRNDVNGQFIQPNDRWYAQPMAFTDRLKEVMSTVKDWWHERVTPQLQHFKDLNYKDPSQLPVVEHLRQAEEIPRYARELVGRFNQRLLVILKNDQDRDTYEHLAVLRDMFREATIGVVSQKGPQQINDFLEAQGYADLGQLQSHIAHFESLRNAAVNEALNLRKSFWDRWRRKAVAADILPDSILENEDYFHHQVKQWQELNEKFSGTAPGMHKTKKSFQKGRTGFAGEYNLDYFASETGVLVDLITQVQTAKSLQDIRNNDKLNVLPRLVAEADRLNAAAAPGTTKETWKTVLKSGLVLDAFGNPITEQTHEFYKPVRGNFFHKVLTLTERSIRNIMEELQNVVGPDPTLDELMDIARLHAGTAIATGLRQPLLDNYMVLNRQIISAMEHFQEQTDPTFLGRMTSYLQTQWKRWILFNPFRVTRYLLNNTTGDADISFAYRPGIFKHVGQAYKELYAWAYKNSAGLTNAQRNKLETLNRKGLLGSGITVHEIPELSDDTLTKLINNPKPQLIKRWFKGVHKFNNFRENIMRLAAWEYMNAENAAGRFADLHYAASNKAEVNAIDSMDDKLIKMSRELIGDYGNLSYVGQKLRKYVIPFWSWAEINAPRYFRMMNNEIRAGNTRGGLRVAGVLGAKAAVRAGAFAALVMAWNFAFFRDEEEEMRRLGRDQLHLILGRHSDGSVISLRVQGSFSDTLGWLGAENLLEELRSLKKGRVTLAEEAKSIAMAPVKRLIGGITPLYKTAAEAATGKSMFPEPFNPRPIRDKFQHIMKGAGLDWITDRYISGKPAPPLFSMKSIAQPFLYITDTHEAAYFHSIKLANDWLKDQGMPRTSSDPTPRSNALYYWRQATKLKDKEAEAYYKALYLKLGGKATGMKQSIKHTDPLVVIPLKFRAKFLSSMGEDNKKTWRMGVRWWQETFKGYQHAPGNTSDGD
jgi:hypothetical protein